MSPPKADPKVGFLEEKKGVRSSMRLMSMVALIASIAFGGITISITANSSDGNSSSRDARDTGVFITFGFLLAAFAPKALQKFAENLPVEQAIEEATDELHRDTEEIRVLKEQIARLQQQLEPSRRVPDRGDVDGSEYSPTGLNSDGRDRFHASGHGMKF